MKGLYPSLIFIKLQIISVIALEEFIVDDYNYEDYNYEEDDSCKHHKFYIDGKHECQVSNFPKLNLTGKYGPETKLCCNSNQYSFYDQCETRSETYGKYVCGEIDSEKVSSPLNNIQCPENCFGLRDIHVNELTIPPNGRGLTFATAIDNSGYQIYDYCLTRACVNESHGWEEVANLCVCINNEEFNKIDSKIDKKFKRCCPKSKVISRKSVKNEIICSNRESVEKEKLNLIDGCSPLNEVHMNSITKITDTEEFILNNQGRNITLNYEESRDYCVGLMLQTLKKDIRGPESFYRPNLIYCQTNPCNGVQPCVSTCCPSGSVWTSNGFCEKNHVSLNQTFHNKVLDKLNVDITSNSDKHFEKRNVYNCGPDKTLEFLDPINNCFDEFELISRGNKETGMRLIHENRTLGLNEYCIYILEDSKGFSGLICKNVLRFHKHRWYWIVLSLSCVSLFITIVIYTYFGKKLLNHYSKLMRHFTINLLIAFIVLIINQVRSLKHDHILICKGIAGIQQYSFLTTFLFMTIMSIEIYIKMIGFASPDGEKRYLIQRICGYGIPITIVSVTWIFELTGPKCSSFRPRFGENECFFTEIESKSIFFYVPIAIMLIFNTLMFFGTVTTISNIKRRKNFNIQNDTKNEIKDRFILYLKLFLGMGIIWFFEILAVITDDLLNESFWRITDVLNMSQGIYVFIIFVCKRNVIKLITETYKKRMTTIKGHAQQLGEIRKQTNYSTKTDDTIVGIQLNDFRKNQC